MFANEIGFSDITPHEVVRVVSDRCFEIRAMKTKLINQNELTFHIGGFSAHCSNQETQQWTYETHKESPIFKIRRSKKGTWKNKFGDTYAIENQPRRRYDFNF
jgi:hypothetical protein